MNKNIVSLLVVLFFPLSIYAQDYYVSVATGSDTNSGTLTSPFKTIQRAASIAVAGDNIYIMAGVYREEVVPTNSGSSSSPITFQAYNNEEVILTGNDIVTGWTQHNGDIYKAAVSDKVYQVFADGYKQDIARHPNFHGDFNSYSDWINGNTSNFGNGSFDSESFATNYWVGATIRAHAGLGWVHQSGIIETSSGSSFTTITDVTEVSAGEGVKDINHPTNPTRFIIAKTSWPWRTDDRPNYLGTDTKLAIYNHINALDTQKEWYWDDGTDELYYHMGGKDASTVTVEARTRYWTFNATDKSYIHIKGINFVAGSVTFENANYCLLENANVLYPAPFMFDAYTDSWIRNLEEENWEGKPVFMSGSNNIIKDCYIAHSWTDGIAIQGSTNKIENCLIEDTDWSVTDAGSISVSGSYHTITHSTVRNTARSIIVHRDAAGITMTNNHLYNCGNAADDLGITYTYKSDGLTGTNEKAEIAYNWIHDNNAHGTASGIYLDNYSSNYKIHHNVIWNTIYAIQTNKTATNFEIYNNTVWKSNNAMRAWGPSGTTLVNQIVKNNLSDKPWNQFTTASNNLQTSSPGFTDVNANDYTLATGSPAIDYGIEITEITDSFAGASPDAGAYEYEIATWTPGSDVIAKDLSSYINTETFAQ